VKHAISPKGWQMRSICSELKDKDDGKWLELKFWWMDFAGALQAQAASDES